MSFAFFFFLSMFIKVATVHLVPVLRCLWLCFKLINTAPLNSAPSSSKCKPQTPVNTTSSNETTKSTYSRLDPAKTCVKQWSIKCTAENPSRQKGVIEFTSQKKLVLTLSLPWCHLKMTNKSVTFDTLNCFWLLFRTGMWKDFHRNTQHWK